MTPEEFDIQFDILYNNVGSNQAVGLNAYEKSVFLTKAQDEIIKNHFLPQSNVTKAGYDDNQKRQIDFSMLTCVYKVSESKDFSAGQFDSSAETKSVKLPSDVMMFIDETAEVNRNSKNTLLVVNPISYDEYLRLMSKPYKRPLKSQAWRLINSSSTGNTADIIVGPGDVIKKYTARYIKKPTPIIIGPLDGLTISGYYSEYDSNVPTGKKKTKGCMLDSILHEEILQRAVELAKVTWNSSGLEGAQAFMQTGQRSE